ncbi:hypothetical protein [Alphaproteobacteria bacterium endosymbiont of Tiliacea citrago]|uniref:hypothetical protein n=1 Tax=Alphaproteobacteria bacterium endosymbiont of Tiliacea citrago TaxID=3077944 RepID=UPI00313E8783
MLRFFSFFILCFLNTAKPVVRISNKKFGINSYKTFYIKSIKGQLSDKVQKQLNEKYWKGSNEKDNEQIKIEYEIFEFLDFLYVKCTITINGKKKSFTIKNKYSKNKDWRHDDELIEKISKTINEQSNFLVCR